MMLALKQKQLAYAKYIKTKTRRKCWYTMLKRLVELKKTLSIVIILLKHSTNSFN